MAAILILTGVAGRVHISFGNARLMERDQQEFKNLWEILNLSKKVLYCVAAPSYRIQKDDYFIFDEADTLIFS
jgi:hypothetical protein